MPVLVEPALDLLEAMDFAVADDLPVFKKASRIACDLNHHLFDTLYHALALEHSYTLVTADETYFRKARSLGSIVRLADWERVASSFTESAEKPPS